ncbi:MAG: aminoacyl-tRNA hydrolase [Candidatus Roizmanbacteria bacterium]|nr:MAG: aminoacyl-tRNA hydrolase [Candidatus Roizmanbacteria bacterium]
MKLLIGLGNPGKKYINNRHNVGFMFVDYIINSVNQNFDLKKDNKLKANVYKLKFNGEDFIVAKPQTFMNLSGNAVQKIISNFKLQISNLIVVHDDLDIPLGKFKIQKGVGPKLHNGLTSIEESLKTKDFLRIRIGVENRSEENRLPGEAYVLQDFTTEEKEIITKVFEEIRKKLIDSRFMIQDSRGFIHES